MAGSEFRKLSGPLQSQVVLAPAGGFLPAELEGSFEPLDLQLAAIDDSVFQLVQLGAERVFPNDTENDRRIGAGKSSGGPLDEFDNIQQIAGFGLVFVGRLRRDAVRGGEEGHANNQGQNRLWGMPMMQE